MEVATPVAFQYVWKLSDVVAASQCVCLYMFRYFYSFTGQPFVSWRIAVLRRYGVNDVCFTFDSGKYVLFLSW